MRGIDELDHYELLEITRGATPAEIDRAYRNAQTVYAEGSLALYSVFDRLDAQTIRSRLDEAYRVLSDPELRSTYEEALPESEAPNPAIDPRPEVGAPAGALATKARNATWRTSVGTHWSYTDVARCMGAVPQVAPCGVHGMAAGLERQQCGVNMAAVRVR